MNNVIAALSREERDVMNHALGRSVNPDGPRDYRNHFAAAPDSDDWPVWTSLAERRLARPGPWVNEAGGMRYFHVTEAGKAALDAPPPHPCFLCRILNGHEGACLEKSR